MMMLWLDQNSQRLEPTETNLSISRSPDFRLLDLFFSLGLWVESIGRAAVTLC